MKNIKLFILCISLLIVGLSGCATSTKKVSLGYSVKPVTELEKATAAYSRKDYLLAAELLEPLAKQGNGYAQYALGYMYYNGLGVPRNRKQAHQLLNASASNGNKNAIEALRLIATTSGGNSSESKDTANVTNLANTPVPMSSEDTIVSKEGVSKADDRQPEKDQPTEEPDSTITADVPVEPVETAMVVPMEQAPVEQQNISEELAVEKTEESAKDDSEKLPVNTSSLTESEKWIISQPDENYTIQLLVSGREAALQQYIKDNDLQDSAIYYKSRSNTSDLFILVQGSFESFSQATKTISLLPPEVKNAKPWIRPIGAVKESILMH